MGPIRRGGAHGPARDSIQWLSDNGPQYAATATVLDAHELGLGPIITPAYSPESNGLAEAFVGTFKRDYVNGAELRDAESVLAQLGGWTDDYNTRAPHSALGMRSPGRVPGGDDSKLLPGSRQMGSRPKVQRVKNPSERDAPDRWLSEHLLDTCVGGQNETVMDLPLPLPSRA